MSWTSLGTLLLLISAIAISTFYQTVHQQSWSLWNDIEHPLLQLFFLFAFVPFVTFALHEFIHGSLFAYFGGSPRYGVGIRYCLPYAYATSPGDRFSRNAFVIIALAPLIIIDLLSLILLAIFPQAAWLGWVVILNTSGAIGDLWVAGLLLRCPASITVEDQPSGFAIYAPPGLPARKLPQPQGQQAQPLLVQWLNLTFIFVLALVFVLPFLPILFDVFNVPSFNLAINETIGFIQWQAEPGEGFNLSIDLWMMAIAPITALIIILIQRLKTR
ncbi:MAG: DUF3267 domain-containing protein [Oculatellaceae cyanobacterium Prado106]|nr:DUF3267 domain-containing protein [Oculatellaceae cyanobacterium Prado106]